MTLPIDWRPPRLIPISAVSNTNTNYWTANILNTEDWAMQAHAFTNSLGTFTNGRTNLCGSAPVSLVTPDIICASYSDVDFDSIDVCLYSVDTVLSDGSAYSGGALGIATAIKHAPYATASLPKSTSASSNINHYIVPWDSSKFLVVYRHEGATATRRIFVVSVVDGTFDEITPSFSAAGWANWVGTNDCHPFRSSDGCLVTANGDTADLRIYKHEVDGSEAYVSAAFTGSPTGLLGMVELDDGSIITCISFASSVAAYKLSADLSTATALTGDPSTAAYWSRTIPLPTSGSFATGYNTPKKWTLSGTTISNSDFIPTINLADDGGSELHWTFQYDRDYCVSRYILDSTAKKIGVQKTSDASAHPTLAVLDEMDSAIPVADDALFDIVAPKISYDPSLAFAADSGYMEANYGVNLVGIVDNEGTTRPLMRATRLVVSNTTNPVPFMEFNGNRVPTVANFIAGDNMSIDVSGSNVTIGTSAAAAVGGIAGAYDIEAHGVPSYTDLGLSDEFVDGTLNTNWTVVNGTSGTVDLLGTQTGPVYDLTTRSKGMLVQVSNTYGEFWLRAPLIGVDEQVIVSLSMSAPPQPSATINISRLGVGSSSTNPYSGNYFHTQVLDVSTNKIYTGTSGGNPERITNGAIWGNRMYWRLIRRSGGFHLLYSVDGTCWIPLGMDNTASAAYVWFAVGVGAWTRLNSGDPIHCVNWIRHCAYTGLDPW